MPKFAGGVYTDDQGYLRISAGPHRNCRVHILVAEAMLGRKLKPDEDVHHKDGNKLNPEWTNLEVIGHQEHGWVSAKQHWYMKQKEEKDHQEWEQYQREQDAHST